MKIIEKIEIKHFRSFLGSSKGYEAVLDDIQDLTILSGGNDSGKSNLLRAMNLFFTNDKINYREPFIFDRDFFLGKKDSGHKIIEISVYFDFSWNKKRDKFLPEKFKISKYYDRYDGYRNYTASFKIKELGDKEIQIDERSGQNDNLYKVFLSKDIMEKLDNKKSLTEDEEMLVEKAKKREWNYRVKFSGFLNQSISFQYVPAIRDESFFTYLIGNLITKVQDNENQEIEELNIEKRKIINWTKTKGNKTEDSEFKKNIQNEVWRTKRLDEIDKKIPAIQKMNGSIRQLEKEINTYSEKLFSSINFLPSGFQIGKNLQRFFEGFDIGTGDNGSISIKQRGDGIQAKLIPKILDFLDSVSNEKYFLWGFEEPENSAEYKNQQELAKELVFFSNSKKKQIFITTHSEEFLQLYDNNISGSKANLYHIKKMDGDFGQYSKIFSFNPSALQFQFGNTKNDILEDLGESFLRAKYSKELKEKEGEFLKQKQDIESNHQDTQKIINQLTKPIVFVEDFYDKTYKIAWLKLKDIPVSTLDEIENLFELNAPFFIYSKNGSSNLKGILGTSTTIEFYGKKIVGIFDFDEAYKDFKALKNGWGDILGEENSCLYRSRSDHTCFHCILIPVPESRSSIAKKTFEGRSSLEMEYLFEDSDLLKLFNNPEYEDIPGGRLIKTGQKSLFPGRVFSFSKDSFINFLPLFNKIHTLFGIQIIENNYN